MAIRSFKDTDAEVFFLKGLRARKKGWDGVHSVVRRKLDMLNYAVDLMDLRSPPSNRLESLKGDLNPIVGLSASWATCAIKLLPFSLWQGGFHLAFIENVVL